MKYRKLGRTGLEIGEIGLGLEHLLPKEQAVVTETIQAAIKGGVNYLDCLSMKEFEKSSGTNEDFVKLGKALEGCRDKVYLSHIANPLHSVEDIEIGFECFLRELNTDYTDIFMIACCDKTDLFEEIINGGLLEYVQKLQSAKKVKFIGLSTHSLNIAHKAIDSSCFDVLMYPVNPAFDVIDNEEEYIEQDLGKLWDAAFDYKPGDGLKLRRKDIYAECVKNNIGLVAMKPFGGGFLFRADVNSGFTAVNLVSYALNQTGVSSVVPGCTSKDEIENILTYYSASEEDRDYGKIIAQSRWNIKGCCQYCNHCLPCSANINIGRINKLMDSGMIQEYNLLEVKASACTECGECETRCPFGVKIKDKMKAAANLFE